jgi:hypothetical protein
MRYLFLLVPLAIGGCADGYSGGYSAYDQGRYASTYDHSGYYGRPQLRLRQLWHARLLSAVRIALVS